MQSSFSSSVRVFYPKWTREELISLLRSKLPELSRLIFLKRAILFGSWAKGRATAFSDVDLFLLYTPPANPKVYILARQLLGIPGLEVHAYTEEEADALGPVLDAMLEGGVELYSDKPTLNTRVENTEGLS